MHSFIIYTFDIKEQSIQIEIKTNDLATQTTDHLNKFHNLLTSNHHS